MEGWTQHVIANDGPDVSFGLVTLKAGGKEYGCIVVGEFFSQRTSIYWTESEDGSWADTSLVREREREREEGRVLVYIEM